MLTREELLQSPVYWLDHFQNELFRQVHEYMTANDVNQAELATKLGVTSGYMSKILRGYSNPTLKQLTRISLLIGLVPVIEYKSINQIIEEDKIKKELYDKERWETVNTSDSPEAQRMNNLKGNNDKLFK